ncbi:MAG: DUF427 domain-containing protein [Myxococcota bacterium]
MAWWTAWSRSWRRRRAPRRGRRRRGARRCRRSRGGRRCRRYRGSHPPTYYLPLADVVPGVLRPLDDATLCEWKGTAAYYDVLTDALTVPRAAWSYPTGPLRDHVAFYADRLACTVDGERARPQPGGFYGGWITSHVAGPFKGGPGTRGW